MAVVAALVVVVDRLYAGFAMLLLGRLRCRVVEREHVRSVPTKTLVLLISAK